MSDWAGDRVNDAEPWPEWRGPAPKAAVALARDADFELENLRAGIAQATALVPFIGPGVAFAVNRRGSFARREAAKAFNGQVGALLGSVAVLGPAATAYFVAQPARGALTFVDFPPAFFAVFAIWAVQALIGVLAALRGRDWTSPLVRLFRVQVLPEGSADPSRPASGEVGGRDGWADR